MPSEKTRLRQQRPTVESEEERTWVGFYRRVGHDAAIAAEVMAQLESDVEMKRAHLALYLSCKESLRLDKARQVRNRRIGRFVRTLLHTLVVRPWLALRRCFSAVGDLAIECLPETRTEPALRQVRRLSQDPEFATARSLFENQKGAQPTSATGAADAAAGSRASATAA